MQIFAKHGQIREGVMFVITLAIDPPSEKQKLFLKANEKYIAFGGARGG